MHKFQVQTVRIEKIRRKTLLQKKHRSGGIGGDGRRIVDQKRWIQRQLVFAADSLKLRVEDSVTAPDNRLIVEAPGEPDAWSPVVPIRFDQGPGLK
jgi:hypothetical protein